MMGCDFNCSKCHNPAFRNREYAFHTKEVTVADLVKWIERAAKEQRTDKVVLTGGDPLASSNIAFTKELLVALRDKSFSVCVYTGYEIEYVRQNAVEGFAFVKTGQFDAQQKQPCKKTDETFTLASKNQQLYNSHFDLLTSNGIFHFND